MRPAQTITLLIAGSLVALGGAAVAQDRLPTTTRSEQTTQSINRQMETQGQLRGIQQQQQFDNNMLRQDIQRRQTMPPPAPIR